MSGGTSGAVRERAGTRGTAPRMPRCSAPAWGAIAVASLFVAVSCWWLAVDRAVPFGGNASHLFASFLYWEFVRAGHPFEAFTFKTYYPPGIRALGVLALALGGRSADGPVVLLNAIFVPLLALACYRVGRMVAGGLAGLLAVVFALGTPLIAEQFHVFMLDAPQAALVAVAVWLILASERFARVDVAALAGFAVGFGVLSKQFMPLFLLGPLAAVLVRGQGWRNWRGIAAFASVALVVAAPWYLVHLSEWGRFLGAANGITETEAVPRAAAPPLISLANLGWYLWATLDGLLLAPLFAFAAIGTAAATVHVVRTRPRPRDDATVALLWGLAGTWLMLTALPHHDVRYTMGAIVYVAVLGTAWIARLRPGRRALATAAFVVAVAAAQLGATFGVGRTPDELPLSNGAVHEGEGVPPRDRVVAYSSLDYLVSGPQRDGDLLGLLRRLRAQGISRVAFEDRGDLADVNDHHFETVGLIVFARIAGVSVEGVDPPVPGATVAHLVRAHALDGAPCRSLDNGTGVWVQIAGRNVCPS